MWLCIFSQLAWQQLPRASSGSLQCRCLCPAKHAVPCQATARVPCQATASISPPCAARCEQTRRCWPGLSTHSSLHACHTALVAKPLRWLGKIAVSVWMHKHRHQPSEQHASMAGPAADVQVPQSPTLTSGTRSSSAAAHASHTKKHQSCASELYIHY